MLDRNLEQSTADKVDFTDDRNNYYSMVANDIILGLINGYCSIV